MTKTVEVRVLVGDHSSARVPAPFYESVDGRLVRTGTIVSLRFDGEYTVATVELGPDHGDGPAA